MMERSVFLVISTVVCALSFLFLCTMLVFVTVAQPDSTAGAVGAVRFVCEADRRFKNVCRWKSLGTISG